MELAVIFGSRVLKMTMSRDTRQFRQYLKKLERSQISIRKTGGLGLN